MYKRYKHDFLFVAAISLLLSIPASVAARDYAGSVTRITGRATITTADGEIKAVEKGSRLATSDMISTSARTYARLKMQDGSYIMVRPDSRMQIQDFRFKKENPEQNRSIISLLKGGFRAVTGLIRDKKRYQYRTPVATIGIRGTDFSARVCYYDCYDIDPVPENGVFVQAQSHDIEVSNSAGRLLVPEGKFAYIAHSDAPPVLMDSMPEVFAQSPIPSADPACEN